MCQVLHSISKNEKGPPFLIPSYFTQFSYSRFLIQFLFLFLNDFRTLLFRVSIVVISCLGHRQTHSVYEANFSFAKTGEIIFATPSPTKAVSPVGWKGKLGSLLKKTQPQQTTVTKQGEKLIFRPIITLKMCGNVHSWRELCCGSLFDFIY